MEDSKVAVLLQDLLSQFRTFGEGLQSLENKIDRVEQKVDRVEQDIDRDVQFELKRIK